MVCRSWTLEQTLFKTSLPTLTINEVDESDLADYPLDALIAVSDDDLGVACIQGSKGILTHIAFATSTRILCIRMATLAPSKVKKKKGKQAGIDSSRRPQGREILSSMLFNDREHRKLAFDMDKIAMALYHDFGLTIVKAVDLQSIRPGDRRAIGTLMFFLGGEREVHKQAVYDTFIGAGFEDGDVKSLALRAWAACRASALPGLASRLQSAALIDTTVIPKRHLKLLARFTRTAWRLHALKPTRVKNDVQPEFTKLSGTLQLNQTRFKTRMRSGSSQKLQVEFSTKNGATTAAQGRVARVNGKSAQISVNRTVASTSKIKSIVTIGREPLTAAEAERERIVLSVLQQRLSFFELPIARKVFEHPLSKRSRRSDTSNAEISLAGRLLNDSQAAAVTRIVSEDPVDQVFLVHGPPGTGKTTVIAASVLELMSIPKEEGGGIWLVAQSNVAVKNIAEKLAGVDFLDFKILVSYDFHFDWHEHLYQKIESNVIRSDDFADNDVGTARLLLGSKVILCTLSMLSTQRLVTSGYTRLVPVETVIIDEASQIEVGDYLPLLGRFSHSIKKLVFIGDHKQLAPFGQDDLGELPSIFEMQHLQQDALFLDTQYRMPKPVGTFISKHVYGGRLKTSHEVTSRRSCILVDIHHGKETKSNNSWINVAEADAIVVIARKFHAEGKTFRVITPYDAQRNLLEQRLKGARLPWENTCFNVDSFQGNEADYVIISVVRSDKVGFLANIRRTNVMLSRCKRGMVICTSRAFMEGKARSSLMGKLAKEWADGWVSWRDTLQGNI